MAMILKVESEGEIRRVQLSSEPDYATVRAALEQHWPGCDADLAKYPDEEGDACTLTDTTFPDFLSTAAGVNGRLVLRLRLPAARAPARPESPPVPAQDDEPAAASIEEDLLNSLLGPWQHLEQEESLSPSAPGAFADTSNEAQGADNVASIESGNADAAGSLETAAEDDVMADKTDLKEEDVASASKPVEKELPAPDTPEEPEVAETSDPQEDDEADLKQTEDEDNFAGWTHLAEEDDANPTQVRELDEAQAELTEAQDEAKAEMGNEPDSTPLSPLIAETEQPAMAAGEAEAAPEVQEQLASTPPQETHAAPADIAEGPSSDAVGLEMGEKVSVIFAAFDADGDGHLNFQELNALVRAAKSDPAPKPIYWLVCRSLGADHRVGLSPENLESLYRRFGTLERDFEAARQALSAFEGEEQPPQAAPSAQPAADQEDTPCQHEEEQHAASHSAHPWFVPLAAAALVAIPIATAAIDFGRSRRPRRCPHCHRNCHCGARF